MGSLPEERSEGAGSRDRIGKGERERERGGGREGSFFVTVVLIVVVVIVVATKRFRQVGMSGAFPSERATTATGRDETNCSDRRVLDPFCGQRAASVAQFKSFS